MRTQGRVFEVTEHDAVRHLVVSVSGLQACQYRIQIRLKTCEPMGDVKVTTCSYLIRQEPDRNIANDARMDAE